MLGCWPEALTARTGFAAAGYLGQLSFRSFLAPGLGSGRRRPRPRACWPEAAPGSTGGAGSNLVGFPGFALQRSQSEPQGALDARLLA